MNKIFILPKGMTEVVVSHSRINASSFIATMYEKSEQIYRSLHINRV